MTANLLSKKNGYTLLPTADPESLPLGASQSKKAPPRPLRPGLFYMFGERGRYFEDHSESEDIELKEMKPKRMKYRKLKSPKSPMPGKTKMKFNVIEEPILPGDTVQRVALRYGCFDSEIRRLNNLYKDQDFFALKTVKIPVREYSILTEPQELEKCRENKVEERTSGNQSSSTSDEMRLGGPGTYYRSDEEESSCDADDEKGDSDGPEYRDISIQSALRWKYSRHTLLQKFDDELQRVRESTESRMSNLREVSLSLEAPAIHPIVYKDSIENSMILHADWRIILGGFIVVVVLGLLFYLAYHEFFKK